MLSQIGGSLGSMGGAGNGLLSSMKNTFNPGVDPMDPASLTRQSAFQQAIGNDQAAARYAQTAQVVEAKQKQAKAQQGTVTLAALGQRMQEISRNPRLTDEQRQAALSGLQTAANETAAKYGLDGTRFMEMSNQALAGARQEEAQALQLGVSRNANERTLASRTLERAYGSGDDAQIEAATSLLEKQGLGDVVRAYQSGRVQQQALLAQAADTIAESGEWTDAESTLATEQLGVTPQELAGWKANPMRGRAQLRARAQQVAGAMLSGSGAKAVEYGVVKDILPGVLADLQADPDANDAWYAGIFDTDVAEIVDDIAEDEEAMTILAARIRAAGATNPQEMREVILEEVRKRDNGILNRWFGGDNAVDDMLDRAGITFEKED